MTIERAALIYQPAGVVQELAEARAASQRLGVAVVQRRADGTWRAVCRDAHDRAARLARIEAEVRPVDEATARRRARLAEIELDLKIDALRAARARSRRGR